jgi:phosphate transport system substrate-binding protein
MGKGTGRTFKGGVGTPGEGNEGTAATVKNTEGAITYNEWSFAQAQNVFTAKIVTPAHRMPVGISPDSVGKTIAGARVGVSGNDLVLDTTSFYQPTEVGAYPIVLATYELVCSKYPTPTSPRRLRRSCSRTSARVRPACKTMGTCRCRQTSSRRC